MKIIFNILFYGVCLVLLIAILSQFGILPFRVTYFLSGSMEPSYYPGDLAIVYTGNNLTINPGDVIFFHINGEPVIHRIISIENGRMITQGDANDTPDITKIEHVDGKLLFSIPKVGYLFEWIQSLFQFVIS